MRGTSGRKQSYASHDLSLFSNGSVISYYMGPHNHVNMTQPDDVVATFGQTVVPKSNREVHWGR